MENTRDISNDTQTHYKIDSAGTFIFTFRNRSGTLVFDIEHPNAIVEIRGLFVLHGKEKYQILIEQNHHAPQSQSSVDVRSVLYDSAHLHFTGVITIDKHAKNCQAHLDNRNLLLGEHVIAESQPLLNILCDEVECSHSATLSNVNPDHLYFTQLRGIDPEKSRQLLVAGFINELFEQ